MKKSLVFIHDSLPAEGISGRVVFLRHFLALKDWDIHIIIPEYAFNQEIVDHYPENFFVHTFMLRKRCWPPFSWSLHLLVWYRNVLWANEIKRLLKGINPTVVIGVLSSVFSIAASYYAKQLNLRFAVFIHDNWLNSVEKDKIAVRKYARKVLSAAYKIWPVTENLVKSLDPSLLTKTELLLPVPQGFKNKAYWRDEMSLSLRCIHVGTVNLHSPFIFDLMLNHVLEKKDQFSVIYYDHPILHPFKVHDNFSRIDFFPSSELALNYAYQNCSVLILYYGLTIEENPYASDSFPSRFIEFAHTGLPIICIAPEQSAFYRFLNERAWPLLFSKTNITDLNQYKERLKTKSFWEACANSTCDLANKEFQPSVIHHTFLKIVTEEN